MRWVRVGGLETRSGHQDSMLDLRQAVVDAQVRSGEADQDRLGDEARLASLGLVSGRAA